MPKCKDTYAVVLKISKITLVTVCCALCRTMPSGMTGKQRTGIWCDSLGSNGGLGKQSGRAEAGCDGNALLSKLGLIMQLISGDCLG